LLYRSLSDGVECKYALIWQYDAWLGIADFRTVGRHGGGSTARKLWAAGREAFSGAASALGRQAVSYDCQTRS